MLLTQPPLSEAIVQAGGRITRHWRTIRAEKHSTGLKLGDARSHVIRFGSLRGIWGEDGFAALSVENVATPSDISGQAMIYEILREPSEEDKAEYSDDDDQDDDEDEDDNEE